MEHMEDEIVNRIRQFKKGRTLLPVKIQYNPTFICNLSCVFCRESGNTLRKSVQHRLFSMFGIRNELDFTLMSRIVEEAADLQVKHFFIGGGGEPFMRKETLQLMKKIKSYEMYGDIITNGTLLTDNIIKDIVKIQWDHVQFSIDGIGKVHDSLRQSKGSFKKIIRAIKYIHQIKKKEKAAKPSMGFSMVLCTKNYFQVTKLMKYLTEFGLDSFNINPLKKYIHLDKELLLNESCSKKVMAELKKARKYAHKINIGTNIDSLIQDEKLLESSNKMISIIKMRSKSKGILCYAPWYMLTIDPYGNIGCCCERIGENTDNNIKNKSLNDIWEGKYFAEVRNNILNHKLVGACQKCGTWQVDNMEHIRERL